MELHELQERALAYRYGVDLDRAFRRTMDELDSAIGAQLPPNPE
ncbi:hypothetical protein OG875_14885 [Streptomyces sp. NBC_01498]|nr:hypothetical protein [Streptomyces sp. NBC_01498]WTL25771.1 hypothetical protein OG875_14885 [Streptomyces sp. NBC_01498]